MVRALAVASLLATGCGPTIERAPDPARKSEPAAPDPRVRPPKPAGPWLKGQLHLHSDASGDSETPATDVVRWYAKHDYDFIVFTDHNRITTGRSPDGMLVLPGVEVTQNLPRCSPAPDDGHQCLLHVNALVVEPALAKRADALPIPTSGDRVEHYAHAMAIAGAMGGVAQLNHPNFHYGASENQIAALAERGLTLFEIANEAWDSNNQGDATHPSTTEIWDRVLSRGGRLYGTATDDAHHYEDAGPRRAAGDPVFVGDLGFVMVRAARQPGAIRDALARGDFYASTGVFLEHVAFADGVFEIRVAEGGHEPHTIDFIADDGVTVQSTSGPSARFDSTAGGHTYVRAVVTDRDNRQAWVQPVFLDGRT